MTEQQRTDVTWEIRQDVVKKRDELMAKCFELAEKLTKQTYPNRHKQLDDMIKLGRMAQEAKTVWSVTTMIK